jgi:hypothetical protein
MYQTHYELPYKEQMRADRQTSNDPLQDGFTCSEMVHHQPSEISNMDMWDGMDAESENLDIERTR